VRVHFGEARHQESIGTIHNYRTLWDRYGVNVTDLSNLAVYDDNRLLWQYDFAAHRHNIYVDYDRCISLTIGNRDATENNQHQVFQD
jgi:hypothetical protein